MSDVSVCRLCGSALERVFVDLGTSPLSNALLRAADLLAPETYWPLRVFVCEECLLVQLPAFEAPESIFDEEYAYFSSYSDSWLRHARAFAETMMASLNLDHRSRVVEVASNDGYLLRWFREAGIPILGIEPAANTAAAAERLGIPTKVAFFGAALARDLQEEGMAADLMVANNVLAHVPDLHDFVEGFRLLLRPGGIATFEFPHLLRLMENTQFDTIYHEHYSYLSLNVVERAFREHALSVHHVEEIPTHGGSLRVHTSHSRDGRTPSPGVRAMRAREEEFGLTRVDGYMEFAPRVHAVKDELLEFLLRAKREGRRVVGYGAPAKGSSLLNFAGIRSDLLPYTVDRSPHKQGRFLPGVRIAIHAPERIMEDRPDVLLILPWNLKDEIAEQMNAMREWGGRFVVPIPRLTFV